MDDRDLRRGPANFASLTPLSFLARSAAVYPRKIAIIHGERRISYASFHARCRRFASALKRRRIGPGATVAVMAPNVPALLEAHYAVPMAGAVLNALNTRLDPAAIAFMLAHGGARLLLADRAYGATVKAAFARMKRPPEVIDIADAATSGAATIGALEYENFLAAGDPDFAWSPPKDEWQAISLLYTSGTTGDPKGVVYHHRGAYLNALGNALALGLEPRSVYLWTLPMFHCNGWTYTWAVTALGGTHVCLRQVEAAAIFRLIAEHKVTHLCGAPIVLNMLANAPVEARRPLPHVVTAATGGAAPPSPVIAAMEAMGFRVMHLYGLTETFGPATICAEQPEWESLPADARARLMARQGVAYPTLGALAVVDPRGRAVASDGRQLGEIAIRGNTVMKGYLKNPKATRKAFKGGCLRTGDLAVRHGNGYVEVKDRAKDTIISGGENISSLEVEEALYRHRGVLEAAVVAMPDAIWGESPCAFVTLKEGASASEAEIIAWCRDTIAHFKCPRRVVFGPLPKTSTGKIQKFLLRARARLDA